MKAGTEKREEKPKAHRERTARKAGGYLGACQISYGHLTNLSRYQTN